MVGDDLFGDPERHHRFAGPARKEHLPSGSTGTETRLHRVDGVLLVGVRVVQNGRDRSFGVADQVGPGNRPLGQIPVIKHPASCPLQLLCRGLGDRRRGPRRGYEQPPLERGCVRFRQERVHPRFGGAGVTVAFGLNGPPVAVHVCCDQVDARIGTVSSFPLVPGNYLPEPVTKLARMLQQHPTHQPLEPLTYYQLRGRRTADRLQRRVQFQQRHNESVRPVYRPYPAHRWLAGIC